MEKKFIIDTDTATDDAVALIMAIKNPDIKIEAITVVAGNVELEKGVRNALYTIALCNDNIPIYAGIGKPIIRPLETAYQVHGSDGLGEVGVKDTHLKLEKDHAVHAIIQKINEQPNEITLVCLAPLTNIAIALQIDPSLSKKVKECIVMGGIGQGRGNITPIAEYNMWADPESAKIVFESGMPIKMVGWDISRKYALLENDDCEQIRKIDSPLAHFALDIQQIRKTFTKNVANIDGFDLPDPIAMAVAIDSSVATEVKKAYVTILTNNDFSRGQTAIDYIGATGNEPNASVVLQADRSKFIKMLHEALT